MGYGGVSRSMDEGFAPIQEQDLQDVEDLQLR